MSRHIKVLLTVFFFYAIYFVLDMFLFKGLRINLNMRIAQWGISHILTYLITGIPLYIAAFILHGAKGFWESWGLNKPVGKAFLAAFLFTLPMLIGLAVSFSWNSSITADQVLIGVIAAAVFEELFFRSFLFGQVFRYSRLGFVPSLLTGAVLFALMHLYQSQDMGTLAGIFAITFAGAVLFGWLYAEWGYNIWVPVFLHMLMNLSWLLFEVSDNALGGVNANVFRFMTVGLAIVGTVVYKRKKGIPFEVNKRTLWMKA
jgi:membrane protease YdiL (CAAX protease family)